MISEKGKEDRRSQIRISIDNLLKENDKTKRGLALHLDIAESNLNRKLNNRITIEDLDKMSSYIGCSIIDILTPMNIASRDNTITGDNKGVVGNSGTVGNVGSNSVTFNGTANPKKLLNDDGISIDFEESTESLQQTNAHLQIRVNDLLAQLESKDALIDAKDKVIALMEGLIGKKK